MDATVHPQEVSSNQSATENMGAGGIKTIAIIRFAIPTLIWIVAIFTIIYACGVGIPDQSFHSLEVIQKECYEEYKAQYVPHGDHAPVCDINRCDERTKCRGDQYCKKFSYYNQRMGRQYTHYSCKDCAYKTKSCGAKHQPYHHIQTTP